MPQNRTLLTRESDYRSRFDQELCKDIATFTYLLNQCTDFNKLMKSLFFLYLLGVSHIARSGYESDFIHLVSYIKLLSSKRGKGMIKPNGNSSFSY